MSTLMLDLKFAFRTLRKSPGFAPPQCSCWRSALEPPRRFSRSSRAFCCGLLPFPDSDRLMVLSDRIQEADLGGNGEAGVTVPDIRAYTRDTRSFTALGGYNSPLMSFPAPAILPGERLASDGRRVRRPWRSAAAGPRVHADEDEHSQQVAVLSYATWQNRFHGDPQDPGNQGPVRSQAVPRRSA